MTQSSLSKINRLPQAVKERISQDDIFSRLDELDDDFGIKSTIILVDLLAGDLDYADLDELLQKDYGFNAFLADQVKRKFGEMIEIIGKTVKSEDKTLQKDESADSRLTFSREDEEEVKRYQEKAPPLDSSVNYEDDAEGIIGSLGLKIDSDVLLKRLRNIIVAKLRGIRDDLETKEALMKAVKIGGMGLSDVESDRIIKSINNPVPAKNNSPAKATSSSVKAPAIADPIRPKNNFKASENKTSIRIEEEDGLPVVKIPENALPMDLSDELPAIRRPQIRFGNPMQLPNYPQNGKINPVKENGSSIDGKSIPSADNQDKLPPPSPLPYVANRRIPASVLNSRTVNKPNLDGVKFEKRLMGPIEELENMTLIEFRRLAADPQASVNKIKEKIDLLGQEAFEKKLRGIDAWHRSEVNRFYRLLGQASMAEGKSIEDIVKERLLAGKPTLSIDELHAIIELNRALRF